MAIVTGTFTATGASPQVSGGEIAIDITLSDGEVAVEWCVDGTNWRAIDSFDAATQTIVESLGVPVRLNCTSYVSPISYALRTR